MAQVQTGDAAAFRVLFDRYETRVHGFILRKTGDPELAADLYQETFLKVYRARSTWTPGRPFRPWLFGIAANTTRDHARRQRRRPHEVELSAWQGTSETPDHTSRMHLEDALQQLPETLKDAFLLGAVEGFDHNEVAAQLAISPDNARARVSRARAWLRERLGQIS